MMIDDDDVVVDDDDFSGKEDQTPSRFLFRPQYTTRKVLFWFRARAPRRTLRRARRTAVAKDDDFPTTTTNGRRPFSRERDATTTIKSDWKNVLLQVNSTQKKRHTTKRPLLLLLFPSKKYMICLGFIIFSLNPTLYSDTLNS